MISEYRLRKLLECSQIFKAYFGKEAINDGRFKEWVAAQQLGVIVRALYQEAKHEKVH